jgi:hypothetical protein
MPAMLSRFQQPYKLFNRPDVMCNPGSIAGVTRSVLCARQKLLCMKWSAIAASWFSIFLRIHWSGE